MGEGGREGRLVLVAWGDALALYGTPYGVELVMSRHRPEDVSATERRNHLAGLLAEERTAPRPCSISSSPCRCVLPKTPYVVEEEGF